MALDGVWMRRLSGRRIRPLLCPLIVDRAAERQERASPLANSAISGIEHINCQMLERFQERLVPSVNAG
jgi:hypothetical protein